MLFLLNETRIFFEILLQLLRFHSFSNHVILHLLQHDHIWLNSFALVVRPFLFLCPPAVFVRLYALLVALVAYILDISLTI